jgi:hypothetical protein
MIGAYGIEIGRRTKKSLEFNDQVSRLLDAFAADPIVISRVVGAAALRLKRHARDVNRRTFPKITGDYNKSIWYKQYKRSARANLYGGNLSSIYEYNGAFIQPMKGQALKFEINGKTIFYKGVIRIDPKPWFFPAMEEAYQRGYVDKAAMKQIERELKEHNLGN